MKPVDRTSSEEEIAASLKRDGLKLDRYVLIADEDSGFSVFYVPPEGGLSMLLIEQEEDRRAHVAFLKKRKAREYASLQEFIRLHGEGGSVRAIPADQ